MGRTKTIEATDLTPMEDRRPVRSTAQKVKTQTTKANPLHRWAVAGVGLTLGLSGWLNGMAFSASAPTPVCGWVLGIAIPVLVLVFSRVSAILYAQQQRTLAYCGAGATLSILLLSVQHCAVSIAALTGEPVALAALMALSVDFGLVICEISTLNKKRSS